MNPKVESETKSETKLTLDNSLNKPYELGFSSPIEQEIFSAGLNEEVIYAIWKAKNEPDWLLNFRLKAYKEWCKMTEPTWSGLTYKPIDYQSISYFAKLKNDENPNSKNQKDKLKSLDDLDPEIKKTFDKLGIPLIEQQILAGVAVDAVLDSVSVATTFKQKLADLGVIFMPFSEAVHTYPDLIKKYLASVVPVKDNFFACLNSAVFSDGTFVFVPKNVICPIELSTYFRINAEKTGQFERTLIVADQNSYVSYLEGCSAPERKENQLHAAVVELVALDGAEIKYSTVQNWYPGDANGLGGVYNFVTKRGVANKNSKISWTQIETGSAITWKYPSCILKGDYAVGEFYSVALTNNKQQADTGTKMIHLGKNTKSRIISKGISAKNSKNIYRGMVTIAKNAENASNYTSCDSLLFDNSIACTFPTVRSHNHTASVQHEATTGNIDQEIMEYCQQRGLTNEQATNMFVNGFVKEIVKNLPLEFAVEAQKLLEINMEGSVG